MQKSNIEKIERLLFENKMAGNMPGKWEDLAIAGRCTSAHMSNVKNGRCRLSPEKRNAITQQYPMVPPDIWD